MRIIELHKKFYGDKHWIYYLGNFLEKDFWTTPSAEARTS